MTKLKITAGPYTFIGKLEEEAAPKTCAAFLSRLPFESQVVHVRWSGEGVWIPLGDYDFGVDYENHTSYPAPGQFILYPGGISETNFEKMQSRFPGRALEKAVKGMLPKGPLGYAMIKKMKVYAEASHPHTAQQPKALEV